jgi:two-component system, cell cycle sensor histidine kinase and response regulator CckA
VSVPKHEKPQTKVPGGTETLLIVEDEGSLLAILQISLQEKRYRIIFAVDGREALEYFKPHQDRIDLVITDLGLPKMSGGLVLRELKKLKLSVKVIVASGHIEPNQKSKLLNAGAKDIIAKPHDPTEVLEKVRSILDGRQDASLP